MSEQDTSTSTPESAETTADDATSTAQDAAETSSDDHDNGKGPKGGADALKADLARERRLRQEERRQREAAQQELQKFKDRDLSDLERAQKAAKEASEELAQARREAARYKVAAKYQISDEDAETFLTADDDEGLAKQAERLAKLATPRAPKPDPSQGSRSGNGSNADMNAMIRRMAGFGR